MISFLWLACSGKINDTATEHFRPTIPVPNCDGFTHSWLSTNGMGDLVQSEQRTELSLSKEFLNGLINSFNIPLPPPTHDVETWYVSYTSQDKGIATQGSAIISFPADYDGSSPLPILLWEHPTVGFSNQCAPTATGIEGAAFPILFASLGLAVVAPDYFGMSGIGVEYPGLHPYVVAEPTAISSLDSVRALSNLAARQGLEVDPKKLSIWGASEGGFAALWTERYLPHYAPEYTSVATIAAIPATDPLAIAQHGAQVLGPASAGVFAALITMRQWYESDALLSGLSPNGFAEQIQSEMEQQCDGFSINDLEQVTDLFTQNFIDGILADDGSAEPWACFLKEGRISTTPVPRTSNTPVFITTAEEDELAIAAPVHEDIETLCEQGYQIHHRQCAGADHVDGAVDTLEEQWDWLQQRLNGAELDAEQICVVQPARSCAD